MPPVTHNSIRVKAINSELVRQALKSMKSGTKAMIAQITGLSVATCGTILNELLATGEVIENEFEESSGGRPAKRFVYNADYSYIACIIVKAEELARKLLYSVADSLGGEVESGTLEFKTLDAGDIDRLLATLIGRYGQIKAVGIGIPGFDHQGVIEICDIPELAGLALGKQLNDKYGLKILVENDMNMTVYGYYRNQNFDTDKTIAVATFIKGSLPGAGLIVDGNMLTGSSRFAGEISFLPLGITREEQLVLLNQPDSFVDLAAAMLAAITVVINPETIALTGDQVHAEYLPALRSKCLESIPEAHMPELIILGRPDEHYMSGLIAVTMESLSYSLQLVERR